VFIKIRINTALEEIPVRYLVWFFFLTSLATISSKIYFIWHNTNFLVINYWCIFFAIRHFWKVKPYYSEDTWPKVTKHWCNKKDKFFHYWLGKASMNHFDCKQLQYCGKESCSSDWHTHTHPPF
jgi:hypothetical protein